MSIKKIAMGGLLAVLTVACAKSEDSKSPATPVVPTNVTFTKPFPGAKLSKAEVAQIKRYFAKKPMMALPPGDLVFASPKADPAELAWKEQMLKYEDPNSYEMLQDIRQGCAKARSTTDIVATFPTDGDVSYENMRAGDKASYSINLGLMNRSGCPGEMDGSFGTSAKVLEVDSSARTAKANAAVGMKVKGLIKNQKYAQLLNSRGLIVESNLAAIASSQDTLGNGHLTMNLSGRYLTLQSEFPYTTKIEAVVRSAGEGQANSEVVAQTRVQFPDFSVAIDWHISGDGQEQVSEVYINGHLVTKEYYEELFGSQNPANPERNTFFNSLK